MALRLQLCLLVLVLGSAAGAHANPSPLITDKGVVASDTPRASKVGAQVLARGGNAVDAAAATALALGVVNPTSSGIGGGGFALIYVAKEKRVYILDFRETGPAAISPKSFVRNGALDTSLSVRGGLAVGVPGEVAGLTTMVKRFGKRSWRQAVNPAARLARRGFVVTPFLARATRLSSLLIPTSTPLGRVLYPRGRLLRTGQRMRRPKLARTLSRIGRLGAAGFYRGPVANDIIKTVKASGGVMTLADLRSYKVIERNPLWGAWRGYTIATMPLPSSAGVVILEALGILQSTSFDVAKLPAADRTHVISEVLKHAFADRSRFLGDAKPAQLAGGKLLAPSRLARLGKRISLAKIKPHATYGDSSLSSGQTPPAKGSGTSHVCVVDAAGNAVALTTTVNGYFGAKLMAGKSGVVLNNEIDDFSLRSGVPNQFGLVQSDFNLVGPGKRPLSSMSPTLVFKGTDVVGCFGGSGGPYIISGTIQTLLNVFARKMNAKAAVEAFRVHHQWKPDRLVIDADAPATVIESLKKRGHAVNARARSSSPRAVQAIVVRPDGKREAASDSRKGGAPAAQR